MIREILCMWLLWVVLRMFGMEIFSIATACILPDPALQVLNGYIQEVPE